MAKVVSTEVGSVIPPITAGVTSTEVARASTSTEVPDMFTEGDIPVTAEIELLEVKL